MLQWEILSKQDNSIWKPIKAKRKLQTTSLYIRTYTTPPGQWAKSDKEKADLFAQYLVEVFIPHNNDWVQEVEEDLSTPLQIQERLTLFTPKEIREIIKTLNPKKP